MVSFHEIPLSRIEGYCTDIPNTFTNLTVLTDFTNSSGCTAAPQTTFPSRLLRWDTADESTLQSVPVGCWCHWQLPYMYVYVCIHVHDVNVCQCLEQDGSCVMLWSSNNVLGLSKVTSCYIGYMYMCM